MLEDIEITIDLGQLMLFVFSILGIILLVAILIGILRFVETLKRLNTVLEKNENNINETLESLPKTAKNLENISEGLNEEMDNVKGSIENVSGTIETTTETVDMINEEILHPLKDVLGILEVVKEFFAGFTGSKKKGFFKK